MVGNVLAFVLIAGVLEGASASLAFRPKSVHNIHMDSTGYVLIKPSPRSANAAEQMCFNFNTGPAFYECYLADPLLALADPVCTSGICPAGAVTQRGRSVTLNPVLKTIDSILATSKANQIRKVSSSTANGFSYLWSQWNPDGSCKAWTGGAKPVQIVNTGEHGNLMVDCVRSGKQVKAKLSGDCCMGIFGVSSPNKPVSAVITGTGYLSLDLTLNSDIAKGVKVNLGGERASLFIYALPGFTQTIKVFGRGSPGTDIEIYTCPPGSRAGAPDIKCTVENRKCVRKPYGNSFAFFLCNDDNRRRALSEGAPPVAAADRDGQSPPHDGMMSVSTCPYSAA